MSKLVVANWKSHKTLDEARTWLQLFQAKAHLFPSQAEIVLCPPFPFLSTLHHSLVPEVALGVQDISPFPAGAYTGAISAHNLNDMGITYALVGHSERRRYFHETHQDVANKVDQAVQNGMRPIVCVDQPYMRAQASAIKPELLAACVVAYEPLEAIGTGDNQPADQVKAIVTEIQQVFGRVPIIYGGSVTSQNALEYLTVTDGVLVGGRSLDPEEFSQIAMHASGV